MDSDASVVMRDGKMLIPVNSANKRKLQGFVYDESSSGKTTFIEPAEIVEITNEISELHFAESREIARILYDFSDWVRPSYPPDRPEDRDMSIPEYTCHSTGHRRFRHKDRGCGMPNPRRRRDTGTYIPSPDRDRQA